MEQRDLTSAAPNRGLVSLAVFLGICTAISVAGGAITITSVKDWYLTLNKPSFNPPDWVFGPAWTFLYLCIAVAGWRVWRRSSEQLREQAMVIFTIQLGLNLLWSFLFFGMQRPGLALIGICALLISVVVNGVMFWRIDRLAGALFVPYAAWVSFASVLNASIWFLN